MKKADKLFNKAKEKTSHENKKDERDLLHGTLILTIEGSTYEVEEIKDFVSKAVSGGHYEMGDIYCRCAMRYDNADQHLKAHDELFYMDFNFSSMNLSDDGNWAKVTSVHFVPASNIYDLALKIGEKISELKLHASIHYKVFEPSGGIASFYNEIVEGKSLGSAEVYHDL